MAGADATARPDEVRIEIRGLRVLGHHGALAGEQDEAQPFEVDLLVLADVASSVASDDLADTLDYGALALGVERVVSTQRFALLEALAGAVADVAMADERVVSASVTLRKLRPPIPADVATAGVQLTRSRP